MPRPTGCSSSSGPSVAEWNLEYKCIRIRTDYGLTSNSATGVVGQFAIYRDGFKTALASMPLGQVGTAELDMSGRLSDQVRGIEGNLHRHRLRRMG